MTQMNCSYCKREMHKRLLCFDGLLKTRDHYIPLSRGGSNAKENIRLACYRCNSIKGNMMPDEWEQYMLDNPLWWAKQVNVRRFKIPGATKAPDAELHLMSAMENAKRVKAYLEKNPPLRPLRKDEPFPIEYDDPIKQAAWESIYKDRKWLLRVPAAVDPS
jgi:hypothetical protein